MPCEYCDADVDGGCRGPASATDCLREQLTASRDEAERLRKAQARSVNILAKAKWVQIGHVDEGNAVTLMFANADDARVAYQAFSDIQDWKGAAEGVDPDALWEKVCDAERPAQKPPLYVVQSDVPPGPEAQAHIERIVNAVSRQMKPTDRA